MFLIRPSYQFATLAPAGYVEFVYDDQACPLWWSWSSVIPWDFHGHLPNHITPLGSSTVKHQQEIYPSTFLSNDWTTTDLWTRSCPNISAGVVADSIGSSCTKTNKKRARNERKVVRILSGTPFHQSTEQNGRWKFRCFQQWTFCRWNLWNLGLTPQFLPVSAVESTGW